MTFQYKKNVYRCEKCGFEFVTVDRDYGVTPFLTTCQNVDKPGGCKGLAQSAFYRVPQSMEPTHEWYRPEQNEWKNFSSGILNHLENGGLLLRPIVIPDEWRQK